MNIPVIMADGGAGTRLWPLSRAGHPKQFLALGGDKTTLQQTAERLSDLPSSESISICKKEHWVVVSGTARVIVGEEMSSLSEDESTYITLRKIHSLESLDKSPLEIIEVQSGVYRREDDRRRGDIYGRM